MPASGTTYKTGKRFQPLNKEFYERFKEETKIEVSWKDYKQIVLDAYKEIMNCVVEDISGFKLPFNLGYLCISCIDYRSRKKPIDFANTKKYNKTIYHLNMHSFGKRYTIRWFRVGEPMHTRLYPFSIEFSREIKRKLATLIKGGKDYNHWSNSDFWAVSRLERSYNKIYKEE